MKTYKLAPNVTAEMLKKYRFHREMFHSYNDVSFSLGNDPDYDFHVNLETGEIDDFGLYGEDIIKDLISKGYVIEND